MTTPRRRSSRLFLILALALLNLAALLLHAQLGGTPGTQARAERRQLVRQLALTDLALFTDARYARHPAMADRHSPFQDAPLALEHFPSGSLLGPPRPERGQ